PVSCESIRECSVVRRRHEERIKRGQRVVPETRLSQFLGADATPQHRAALEHADSLASLGQQRGAYQGIDSAADNNGVKRRHRAPRVRGVTWGSWKLRHA